MEVDVDNLGGSSGGGEEVDLVLLELCLSLLHLSIGGRASANPVGSVALLL